MNVSAENRKNIKKAIDLLKTLFKKHNDSRSWATNIINASKHLSGEVEWSHFYYYLADPQNYNIDTVKIEKELTEEKPDLEQDDRYETVTYKNGNETVIHLKLKEPEDNLDWLDLSEEDEKKEE